MNQLWLSVLLKDTTAVTGQAGIRIHILTPELESNALDRSAMALHATTVLSLVNFGKRISDFYFSKQKSHQIQTYIPLA